MAPTGDNPQNYAWAPEGGNKELANQQEELSSTISELEFRSQFLTHLENSSDFKAMAVNCDGAKSIIKHAFEAAKSVIDIVINIPVVGKLLSYVKTAFDKLNSIVDSALTFGNSASYLSVNLIFSAAKTTLSVIATGPLKSLYMPFLRLLTSIQSTVNDLVKCVTGTSKVRIEVAHCNDLANLYRLVVSESVKTSPALNLPADASPELKRLAAGSLSLLDLLEKSSIAAKNEDLLTTRPIFAADVLNQYRTELLRVSKTDEIRDYAQASLTTVVGMSNALEACLRVAADPVGAIDELNEELEAQAFYDEGDENEGDGDEGDEDY
ncbi:hypothetical protein BGZ54_010177 [Gamsiella multidivaricata]|nr:hypothetical protein BGZ54_010177 [Gamsiella multidivaricata]